MFENLNWPNRLMCTFPKAKRLLGLSLHESGVLVTSLFILFVFQLGTEAKKRSGRVTNISRPGPN